MRRPGYLITWPADTHPAVLDLVSRQLRAEPMTDDLRQMIELNGGRIERMEPVFEHPRPAIVRRALALHR